MSDDWLKRMEKERGYPIRRATSPEGEYKIWLRDHDITSHIFSKWIAFDGMPHVYHDRDAISITGKTHRENYERLIEKRRIIEDCLGFTLISIWECEYKRQLRNECNTPTECDPDNGNRMDRPAPTD